MSRRQDVRPLIIEGALTSPDLSPVQRVYLITVATLATEYIDGRPRKGSRGMGADGKYALHLDYLARALHTSPDNAKKQAQRLEAAGVISKVHPGTFGRPAMWQALDVRGDRTYRVTFRRFVPPYGTQGTPTRGDTVSPLTYRTPDHPDHETTAGGFQAERIEVMAATKSGPEPAAPSSSTGCQFHPWSQCPEDCRNHPQTGRASA